MPQTENRQRDRSKTMRQLSFIAFILSGLFATVTSTGIQAFAKRKTNLDDVRFTSDVIQTFNRSVSVIGCARLCLGVPGTKSITFRTIRRNDTGGSSSDARCRCYSSAMEAGSPNVTAMGTRYYDFVDDRNGLAQPCSTDGNCSTLVGGMCFLGKCLCHPNHFYSVSQGKCIANCSDSSLGTQWLRYPNSSAASLNTTFSFMTLHACKTNCRLNEPSCQAVEVDLQVPAPTNCGRWYKPTVSGEFSINWLNMSNRVLHKRTCQ